MDFQAWDPGSSASAGQSGESRDPPLTCRQSHTSYAVVGSGGSGGHWCTNWWACRLLSSLLKVGTATIPLSDSFLSSLVHCPHLSSLDFEYLPFFCAVQPPISIKSTRSQLFQAPSLTGYKQKSSSWIPEKLELVCVCSFRVPLTYT